MQPWGIVAAFSLSTVIQGALAPLTGVLVDRLGPRPVITSGVVLLAASSILAGTIHAPWQLYLVTGVIGALGILGLGWVPMGVLLSRWIHERRGRMVGIAFSGMGVYGVLNVANGIGAAVGPWFGGIVHDTTGSYRLALASSVVFCAVGAVCFRLAARRAP